MTHLFQFVGTIIIHVYPISRHESKFIKKIVATIFDNLSVLKSCVDEDLIGMRTRFQDFESLLDIGSGGVCMVGIWGVGGGGKTTLATSVYMKISQHFQGHCIVENVREETSKHGLNKLQENILSALSKTVVKVHSVVEGKHMMKSMLCRRRVLVLLDHVDKLDQLEVLAGKHNWFGSGSRIIITTRDKHLLRAHKVDHVYPVKLLSHDESIRLFKRHAYNEEDPVEDYETLSLRVVSYASGLPLALKVLGSFLYDKDKNEWISALEKLKHIPNPQVMNILKISYDGLEPYEKELFLDIACFFRRRDADGVVKMLEACGYHPKIGIKVLMQKALITIVDHKFDMHDLVQEMGHYIVRGDHPHNPEKHNRLWKQREIEDLPFWDERMENDKIEAILYNYSRSMENFSRDHNDASRICKIVSKMKKLRLLMVDMRYMDYKSLEKAEGASFLSNELQYMRWSHYPSSPFPRSFQPVKLVTLSMCSSLQKKLWNCYKHLPHLKELDLGHMERLLITPDFDGLPRLQKLKLYYCYELEEIHPSLGNHTSLEYLSVSFCFKLQRLPTISRMKNIKTLQIMECYLKDGEIPCGIGELSNLQELNLSGNSFSRLDFSLSQLTRLKSLDLSWCNKLLELPELSSSLAILTAHRCKSLTIVEDFNKCCKQLCQVSLKDGWSDTLLQSMLKGNSIGNGSMNLLLEGVEIAKGFTPPLLRGRSCRLELPENWRNDFYGFLMCAVIPSYLDSIENPTQISMMQASGMDFQDGVIWNESDSDNYTRVWYVSFGSLRHTDWWNQTYNSICFNNMHHQCNCFGVRLVDKKSGSGLIETSTNCSSHYMPKIEIKHESASALTVSLIPYRPAK